MTMMPQFQRLASFRDIQAHMVCVANHAGCKTNGSKDPSPLGLAPFRQKCVALVLFMFAMAITLYTVLCFGDTFIPQLELNGHAALIVFSLAFTVSAIGLWVNWAVGKAMLVFSFGITALISLCTLFTMGLNLTF